MNTNYSTGIDGDLLTKDMVVIDNKLQSIEQKVNNFVQSSSGEIIDFDLNNKTFYSSSESLVDKLSSNFKFLTDNIDKIRKNIFGKSTRNYRLIMGLQEIVKITFDNMHDIIRVVQVTSDKEQLNQMKIKINEFSKKIADQSSAMSSVMSKLPDINKEIQKTIDSIKGEIDVVAEEIDVSLQAIAIDEKLSHGFSMEGYFTEILSYDEYQIYKHIRHKHDLTDAGHKGHEFISVAERQVLTRLQKKGLSEVIDNFENNYIQMIKNNPLLLSPLEIQNLLSSIESGTATKEQVDLVVNCKKWMMELITQEGSLIDIPSFNNAKGFELLGVIDGIANLQSKQIDEAINEAIWKEHNNNRSKDEARRLQILVEGAGPMGMYTAMQLFNAGSDVSVVNDRGERNVRSQIIALDPKWRAQLRYFLGSRYATLFLGEKALGNIVPKWGHGTINIRNLEDQFKARLVELSSYVQKMEQAKSAEERQKMGTSYIRLIYEANLTAVEPPKDITQTFSVKLEPLSKPSPDQLRFEQALIDSKAVKIMEMKYPGRDFEEKLDNGKTILQQAMEEAKAEFLKAKEPRALNNIPVNMLICCGGAKDRIRDEYLCPAIPITESKSYGIAVWEKGEKFRDQSFIGPDGTFAQLVAANLQPHIMGQNLDKYIVDSDVISDDLKKQYVNLSQMILEDLKDPDHPIYLRMLENKETFYSGVETPKRLALFFKAVEAEKNKKSATVNPEKKPLDQVPEAKKLEDKYSAFLREADKRWFAAIANMHGVDDKQMKLDPAPINMGSFLVQQLAIDVAAKEIKSMGKSLLITALGDARASPHFYSGSGMSSGRMGLQRAAKLVQEYNTSNMPSDQLASYLNEDLEEVKDKVTQKGAKFMRLTTEAENKEARRKKTFEWVNKYWKISAGKSIEELGYKVILHFNQQAVDSKNPNFMLNYLDKTGNERMATVEVTDEGDLLAQNKKSYVSFTDLTFAYMKS